MEDAALLPNPQRSRRYAWLAWILCGIVSLVALANLLLVLRNPPAEDNPLRLAGRVAWTTFPIVFAVVAALIISRQPRNAIGWLLLAPALVMASPVEAYIYSLSSAPAPTLLNLALIWFQSWSWLLLIFPILLILLLFPTGRPPSPRWRVVLYWALGMAIFLILLTTFSEHLTKPNGSWSVSNPIGFIPDDPATLQVVVTVWVILLSLLTIACATSLFVRYHRAQAVEREQIKWLLYAAGIFVLIYVPILLFAGNSPTFVVSDLANLILPLSLTLFPIAIAFAILRYRLWDIDVLIRRTLIYGGLTITLAAIYFGLVVTLQELFSKISNQQSTVSIVLSTLAIAALFSPLRRRIQAFIDLRFYRKKYDAEQVLARFAASVRDEVELERLTAHLLAVVDETVQPESASLWLKPGGKDLRVMRVVGKK